MVCLSIGARSLRSLDGSTEKGVSMHGVCYYPDEVDIVDMLRFRIYLQ